jgi:chemotaxis response regulator CheB
VQKAKILIVEDRNSLMLRLFKKLLVGKKDEVLIAPNSELALLLAKDFKPNVVISDYNPIGNLDSKELAIAMKRDFDVNTIFLSQSGNELRIEDGWLDVHVKNHTDSVSKILELINQLYW